MRKLFIILRIYYSRLKVRHISYRGHSRLKKTTNRLYGVSSWEFKMQIASYNISPLLLAAIKRILCRDVYTVYIHVAGVARECAVICRLNARRKCTKMFTEPLDLVRLSTVRGLPLLLSFAASNNECVLASEMPMQWEPPGACRCTQQRLSIAKNSTAGLDFHRELLSGIRIRDAIVSAVRSPQNETLMYLAFWERKAVENKKKVAVYLELSLK